MPDEPENQDDYQLPPSFFPYGESEEVLEPEDQGEPIEITVEGVFFAGANNDVQRYVLLSDGERKLPIMIGAYEATAIMMALEDNKPDRPMTHDLLKGVIDRLEGLVEKIVIDDLWNKTYYAKITLRQGKTTSEIDCRPSDAIALGLRCECPIYVRDNILEQGFE